VTGVWSDGGSNYYKGVWHLHNSNFNDSTSTGNNGTNSGTNDVTGQMANGRNFDADTDTISLGTAQHFNRPT